MSEFLGAEWKFHDRFLVIGSFCPCLGITILSIECRMHA